MFNSLKNQNLQIINIANKIFAEFQIGKQIWCVKNLNISLEFCFILMIYICNLLTLLFV